MPSSPTGVDAPLEYLTVDAYAWPKAERSKRFRQEAEVRKIRHRENQRRFMIRKQARVATMRREVALMELQFKYLQALQEEQALWNERRAMEPEEERKETVLKIDSFEPLDVGCDGETMVLDSVLAEVLLSL